MKGQVAAPTLHASSLPASPTLPTLAPVSLLRRRLLGSAGASLAASLAGCGLFHTRRTGDAAQRGIAGGRRQVVPFSASAPDGATPTGWHRSGFWNSKKPTRYQTVEENGVTILEAEAEQGASGLFCEMHVEPAQAQRVQWRWRTKTLIPTASVGDPKADDAVARLIVSFDGDPALLSFKDMLFREQALLFAGIDLPHSMLIYVWDTSLPVGSVLSIRETTRIRYLVVESGPARLGEWVDYDRDLAADFRRAFDQAPGAILNIGVTTDANDTKSSALTYYGDIRLTG